jgi:hypothetical protein
MIAALFGEPGTLIITPPSERDQQQIPGGVSEKNARSPEMPLECV